MIPSCIRAPPEQVKRTTGSLSSVARSTARVIFSPTACPILAIINLPSQTPITTGYPQIVAFPVTTASSSPVFTLKASTFSVYPRKSNGFSGLSPSSIFASHSSKEPASVTSSILLYAGIRKYPRHLGQIYFPLITSSVKIAAPHLLHFFKIPSGASGFLLFRE